MKPLLSVLAGIFCCACALGNTQYDNASHYANGEKGKGLDTLKNADPAALIPGFTDSPEQSKLYGGITADQNSALDSKGTREMNHTEAGKALLDVIKHRPPDRISTDAPFIHGSLEVEDKAESLTQDTDTQCRDVEINNTQITRFTCERTPAVELTCTRNAGPGGGHAEDIVITKTFSMRNNDFVYRYDGDKRVTFQFRAPASGTVIRAMLTLHFTDRNLSYRMRWWGVNAESVAKKENLWVLTGAAGATLSQERFSPVGEIENQNCLRGNPSRCQNYARKTLNWLKNGSDGQMSLTLEMQVREKKWVPDVVWTETCPFDPSEQVKTGSVCTSPGGNRTFIVNGQPVTLHSACWQYTDTYISQSPDNGTCDPYMKNPACTVGSITCIASLSDTCLREHVVFSCEKHTRSTAHLCGGELVCADGSCDHAENKANADFRSAVSGLAALAAAGKDVAQLNSMNVSAFTGKAISCRKAMAGFSNCCRDSGWGQDTGLASCSSEEKALGQAKARKLTIYVGGYCAHKILGVCTERKEGYCQFDSKLAKIIQEQGRRGQLGKGFGRGESPDCRGLSVAELQHLDFSAMNFADFYDDLENGTTLPEDQFLIERIKQQITDKMKDGAQ
ncbi:type-F conjugative transfer system mating-pair stabilization protein TraN [Enterobacter sichuanensis]